MPSRPLRQGQKTFYLDQSTLSDAFRSQLMCAKASEPEYAELRAWIDRVAAEANLCLSPVHILETARWSEAEGDELAEWLDGLDIVWVYPYDRVQAAEDERLTRVVARVANPSPVSPFAPSLMAAMRDSPTAESSPTESADPSIRTAVREVRGREYELELAFAPNWVRVLQEDRAFARDRGVNERKLRERLALNWRVALRRRASEAHNRIVASGDAEYAATGAQWGTVQDPFVDAYEADPTALPVTVVIRAFSAGFERETKVKKPGGQNVKKALASSFYDLCHAAVGASYCDVFTCDEFTARCLGDVRERLGHSHALWRKRGESPARFIDDLMATHSERRRDE